jgi:nitrogen regulatory protein P-II 1
MTKVEAIIQPAKLEAVKRALHEIGVEGMTVLDARGHGRQKGHTEVYRGREYTVDLIPKVKVEMVLADSMVDKVVQTIADTARTGKIGDGKIFLTRIDTQSASATMSGGSTRCSYMVEGPPPPSLKQVPADHCLQLFHRYQRLNADLGIVCLLFVLQKHGDAGDPKTVNDVCGHAVQQS